MDEYEIVKGLPLMHVKRTAGLTATMRKMDYLDAIVIPADKLNSVRGCAAAAGIRVQTKKNPDGSITVQRIDSVTTGLGVPTGDSVFEVVDSVSPTSASASASASVFGAPDAPPASPALSVPLTPLRKPLSAVELAVKAIPKVDPIYGRNKVTIVKGGYYLEQEYGSKTFVPISDPDSALEPEPESGPLPDILR